MFLFRRSVLSFARTRERRAFIVAFGALAFGLLTPDSARATGVHSTLLSYSQLSGTVGNGLSLSGVISDDESLVAFSSNASNLVTLDSNNTYDIFLLNKVDHSFEIASRASGATGALANRASYSPDLSLNARHVVFYSDASNLVPEVLAPRVHIYLRDRETEMTELISIAHEDHAPAERGVVGLPPRISANGCRVVFTSNSRNLVPGGWTHWLSYDWHVYLRDRCEDRTVHVSRPLEGYWSNGNSGAPVISQDGRFVAFISQSTTLPLANGGDDVFVYDVDADEIIQRLDFDAMPFGIGEGTLDIDSAGRYLIGLTYLPKTPEDTNGQPDAYRVDIRSGDFELVSANSDGTVPAGDSVRNVSISGDGKSIAFSTARNLTGELPPNARRQVWTRDLSTGATRLVSRHWQTGTGSTDYEALSNRISRSGDSVTFGTHANLDPRDTSFQNSQLYGGSGSGYAFQVVDPHPDLIYGGEVNTDLDQLKDHGRLVDGMAADGVTRLLLRFHASEAGTIRFSISDEFHADSEFVGSLSSVGGNESATDELEVPVVTLASGEMYAFAILKAPEGFDRPGVAADSASFSRSFFVSATVVGSGASIELERSVIRPPVALVHGVWSSRKTWDYALLQSPYFYTFLHDYEPTHASSFAVNSYQTPIASWDALESFRSLGFAATQVDYIGHSMAGLLARQWVAGDLCKGECNSRSDNFFAGDLNRLITLGTPHAGSQLANELWEMWEQNGPLYAWPLRRIEPEMCVDCGAIKDMRADESPIRDQRAAIVPAHAVVGTGGQEDSSAKSFLIDALLLAYRQTTTNEVFGLGVQHDGIVERSSQEGGLLPPNITVIEPTGTTQAIHTSEPNEAAFGTRMEELLRLRVSADEFAQGGFPAQGGVPGIAEPLRATLGRAVSPDAYCQESCLDLQITAGGPVFYPGTEVTLEATGLEGFKPERVLFLFGEQELLVDSLPFVATFTIPMQALGEIVVGAVAKGQEELPPEALYQFDFVEGGIDVEQEATLEGLRLEPPTLKSSPAFPWRTLRVFGTFSDDIERELTGYTVSFTTSDPAIAAVSNSGEVRYLQPGIASIVASFEGLETSAWVEVSTPPVALFVSEVTRTTVTVMVDKLRPLQNIRIFATTDLSDGHTAVAGCLRLELGLKDASQVPLLGGNWDDTSYREVDIPIPAGATALALQVVTDDCAISPAVVAFQ